MLALMFHLSTFNEKIPRIQEEMKKYRFQLIELITRITITGIVGFNIHLLKSRIANLKSMLRGKKALQIFNPDIKFEYLNQSV